MIIQDLNAIKIKQGMMRYTRLYCVCSKFETCSCDVIQELNITKFFLKKQARHDEIHNTSVCG
jgi:hypothetical protein